MGGRARILDPTQLHCGVLGYLLQESRGVMRHAKSRVSNAMSHGILLRHASSATCNRRCLVARRRPRCLGLHLLGLVAECIACMKAWRSHEKP